MRALGRNADGCSDRCPATGSSRSSVSSSGQHCGRGSERFPSCRASFSRSRSPRARQRSQGNLALLCSRVRCAAGFASEPNGSRDTGEFEQAIALVDELGRLQNIRVSDAHGICENDKSPLKLGDAGKAAHGSIGDLRPSSGVPLQLRSKACSVRPQSMDATAAVVLLAYIEAYTVWQTDLNSARITPVPLADAPEVPSCRTSSISGGWIRTSANTWGPADLCGCHGAS